MASFNSADEPWSRRFSIESIFSSFFGQLCMTNSIGEFDLVVCPAHENMKKTATANKLVDVISNLLRYLEQRSRSVVLSTIYS